MVMREMTDEQLQAEPLIIDIRRFWQHVSIGGRDDCWPWTAALTQGYGQFSGPHRRSTRAHRFAYWLQCGDIPPGLVVDHLCRNRACQNAKHMELVSTRENVIRGVGYSAMNAQKTHCSRGHEYTAENTRIYIKNGQFRERACRACARLRWHRRKESIQ